MDTGLGGLHRIVLVMYGRSRTGQIVDLVDLDIQRPSDIVPDQLETLLLSTPAYISFVARIKIINAQDFVSEF